MSEKPLYWWPTDVETLCVEETDKGFSFSAQEGTDTARWLQYYSESDERRELFQQLILSAVRSAIDKRETWALESTIQYFRDALRMCPTNKTTREAYQSAVEHLTRLQELEKKCTLR